MVLGRGANQIATGLVVTFLGLGLTALFGQDYVARASWPLDDWDIPAAHRLPFLGPILFEHDPLTYLSIVMAVARLVGAARTRSGHPPAGGRRAARGARHVRHLARPGAGAWPSSPAGPWPASAAPSWPRRSPCNWSENMTVGRGFVAVGLVIFAAWDPLKAIAGAYLFSGAEALQL